MANEKRSRTNNVFGALGAAMLVGDTSINFGTTAPGFPTIDSTKHAAIIIEPDTVNEEIVYLTAFTAGGLTGTIARGQEGTTAVAHGVNAVWVHGPTKRETLKAASAVRTAGNVACSSTVWAAFDTALDLAVPAWPGDMIEASLSSFLGNEASDFFGDYCTLVGGVLTTSFATGAAVVAGSGGAPNMRGVASSYTPIGGPLTIRAAAGDISGGLVTVRFVYRVTSATRTAFASSAATNVPMTVSLKNLGPQEA